MSNLEINMREISSVPIRIIPDGRMNDMEINIKPVTVTPIKIVPGNRGEPIPFFLIPGVPGPPGNGSGTGDASYSHVQSQPSAVWTVVHNLGFRPNIHVSDTAGSEVEGEVEHLNANTAVLTFSAPFSGQARCS